MAETITLEVARYRPEAEMEPIFQSFEVSFRKDWVTRGLAEIAGP